MPPADPLPDPSAREGRIPVSEGGCGKASTPPTVVAGARHGDSEVTNDDELSGGAAMRYASNAAAAAMAPMTAARRTMLRNDTPASGVSSPDPLSPSMRCVHEGKGEGAYVQTGCVNGL
jgi:hypothetical protein